MGLLVSVLFDPSGLLQRALCVCTIWTLGELYSALRSKFEGICSTTWETFSPLGNKQRVWHLPWQPISPRGLCLVAQFQDTMGKLQNQSWPVMRAVRGFVAQSTSEQSQHWCLGESKAVSQGATETLACSNKTGWGTRAHGPGQPCATESTCLTFSSVFSLRPLWLWELVFPLLRILSFFFLFLFISASADSLAKL